MTNTQDVCILGYLRNWISTRQIWGLQLQRRKCLSLQPKSDGKKNHRAETADHALITEQTCLLELTFIKATYCLSVFCFKNTKKNGRHLGHLRKSARRYYWLWVGHSIKHRMDCETVEKRPVTILCKTWLSGIKETWSPGWKYCMWFQTNAKYMKNILK